MLPWRTLQRLQSANRYRDLSLRRYLLMLVAIEELALFLAREVDPIAHCLRWRCVACILTFYAGTFRQFCLRLRERYPRGWFDWAFQLRRIIQTSLDDVRLNNAGSFILTISMFREKMQLNGRSSSLRLKVPFISSIHIMYLIHAFSSCIMTKHSRLSNPFRSIQQWYSHPPLRAGRSRR